MKAVPSSVPSPQDDRYTGAEAAITYRYLRLGMVGLIVLLFVSVLYERTQAAGCWQTSISAYYYTPVRSIFVGVLIAIGLCLIVIRGRDPWQDGFLNVAGMLAPIVALVPTSDSGRCLSTEAVAAVADDAAPRVIAPIDIAGVQNNLVALFVTGVLALVVAYMWRRGRATTAARARIQRFSVSFAVTVALVAVGFALFVLTDWFERVAHLTAAAGMFFCLGVVVFIRWRASSASRHGTIYKLVWQGMALSVVVGVLLTVVSVDHAILLVELAEIACFMAFWVTRTHEDWDAGVTAGST